MRLSNVCDEDLKKIALLKNKNGIATSDAKRAQQILYTRNISLGGYGGCGHLLTSTLEKKSGKKIRFF